MPPRTIAPMSEVTLPLHLLIPNGFEHYFSRVPEPRYYTRRAFEFRGEPVFLPLVHAFLETCAAAQSAEYRYLFNLLGTEIATNAIKHTRSGRPGESFALHVDRSTDGLTLTCRDRGGGSSVIYDVKDRQYLTPARFSERLTAEDGRGLALVNSLATAWGDNGRPSFRQVWFFLAYDLAGSAWSAA